MGKLFDKMHPEHIEFMKAQHLFFVASAPLSEQGRVNVSPKGYDCFRVVSNDEVGYLDLTGSGNETSAHLEENGRITVMFTAFQGQPMILRLYGTGRVVLPGSEEWENYIPHFQMMPGARQLILVRVHQVMTSCGYSVPNFEYTGDRSTLLQWAENKGEEGLREYRQTKNSLSLDGLPTPLAVKQK